ncbi:MAG: ankyrin repeat domain-containing protein [Candidatus Ratteibacteria bacterium]|nr:ankyrin repeat domain-containing protein [Candidatus Ratteibacteria bacterium]
MGKLGLLFVVVFLFSTVNIVYADINEEFLKALTGGNKEQVRTLLDKGADINTKDKISGDTALMWAALVGRIDIVKFLIDNGADVNIKNNVGNTALMEAALNTPVYLAISMVKDTNMEDEILGDTRIMAFQKVYADIVKLLIENGADINAKDNKGNTALMMASITGQTDTVKLLIDKGTDVNAKNNNGITALMLASGTNTVKLLIEKGADVNIKANDSYTALKIASERGDTAIIELLKQAGAKEKE